MKKPGILSIIILIVAILLNSFIAGKLKEMQYNEINKDRKHISKTPMASFHKFWADIQWIIFIQFAGGIDRTTDKNAKELNEMAKNVIGNDPCFYKAYDMGALMISYKAPDDAVKLLDKAQETDLLSKDWRIPARAGSIRQLQSWRNKENNEKLIVDTYTYFEKALQCPNVKNYILTSYIRTKASHAQQKDSELPPQIAELETWLSYYETVNSESLGEMGAGPEGMDKEDMNYLVPDNIKAEILQILKEVKAKKLYNNKRNIQAFDTVRKRIFPNIHVCEHCFTQYGPAQEFCTNCVVIKKRTVNGREVPYEAPRPVVPYGMCLNSKCKKPISDSSNFCGHCGIRHRPKKKKKKGKK